MPAIAFYGDEAEAAGWRLAGIDARIAPAHDPGGAMFSAACADVGLLLLDPATARRLDPAALNAARALGGTRVCVLPAFEGETDPDPVVAEARRLLGMEP